MLDLSVVVAAKRAYLLAKIHRAEAGRQEAARAVDALQLALVNALPTKSHDVVRQFMPVLRRAAFAGVDYVSTGDADEALRDLRQELRRLDVDVTPDEELGN